jgi:hypothetical protein
MGPRPTKGEEDTSWRTHSCVPCSHSCEHILVGRTPWSAADAHVGLLVRVCLIPLAEERVQGDPRGPGGPPWGPPGVRPTSLRKSPGIGKTKGLCAYERAPRWKPVSSTERYHDRTDPIISTRSLAVAVR